MDFNSNELLVGDLVADGQRILWEETPEYKVWMTREGDKLYITTEYNSDLIAALLDKNRQEKNDFNKTGSHGSIVKVASVPVGLYYEWQRQGITDDEEAMRRRLNDADYSKFRTNDWRL